MISSVEMRQMLYSILPMIGWLLATIFNFTQYKTKKEIPSYCTKSIQKKISKKPEKGIYKVLSSKTLWAFLEISVISLTVYLSTIFNFFFGNIMKTGANYYGFLFFCPVVLVAFCCALWINPIKQIDLITPSLPLAMVFIRLGCLFQGCCNGVKWEYGIYNYFTERPEVPTPLLESILALGLFIFLLIWRKKSKAGTLYPMYMLLYSFFRFFIEFVSADRVKYFSFFNKYQILCLVGVLVGVALFLLMLKYGEKISTYFDENPYGFIKAIIAKIKKPKKEEIKTE